METQLIRSERERGLEPKPGLCRPIWLMLALAGAAALAVVVPFFFLGNASGHDFEFHLASWMDVVHQWREGVIYPRWAELANWGYGEPRFIFYPPVSWMLGAALSFIFPWSMVPGAFIWLALTLAGVSMYALAREWLRGRDAIAAGVLFALNPYHLLIVYWRSDFAELLASALIPLAVLFAMRMASAPRRSFVPLALVTAAICLCNAPAAVVVTYGTGLILLALAIREHGFRPLVYGGGALALGFALAAFYIVPAMFEQPWVNISEVLAQGLTYPENFLFTRTRDLEHTRFNFIASWVAVVVMVSTCAALIVWRFPTLGKSGRRVGHPGPVGRPRWVMLVLVVASIFLMLPVSAPLWKHAPELRYVQFPWRWLLVLDVPFALCLAAALGRLNGARLRAGWAAALVGLVFIGLFLTRSNWWDAGGAADFYEEHVQNSAGYFGVDEYGPRGSDHYDLDQKAPLVTLSGGRVEVRRWGAMRKEFFVRSREPATAILRLLNYPAWRVTVNGNPVRADSVEHTRQMVIQLPSGTSQVLVWFATTRDRVWGDAISALALMAMLAGATFSRRETPSPPL